MTAFDELPEDVAAIAERLERAGFRPVGERGSGRVDHLVWDDLARCRARRARERLGLPPQ